MSATLSGSSIFGSGGTTGSGTGSGGVGTEPEDAPGLAPPVEVVGRANGGLGFPHATLPSETAISIAAPTCRICSRVIRCLFFVRNGWLLRPVRILVDAGFGDLPERSAVARDRVNLLLAGAIRDEGEMPAVRRERRALVAA